MNRCVKCGSMFTPFFIGGKSYTHECPSCVRDTVLSTGEGCISNALKVLEKAGKVNTSKNEIGQKTVPSFA